jgi:hypothetical protein
MAPVAWTLLTLLTALPAGLQLENVGDEVGGGRPLMKVFWEVTNKLFHPKQMLVISQDPEHVVNMDKDITEDTSMNLWIW